MAKGTKRESWKTTLGSQRNLTKNRHSDSLKKSRLTLSQGMMKKGDVIVVADDDDDEVKPMCHEMVDSTLCSEELFLRTQYI